MIENAQANNTPKIQVKYHIICSLIQRFTVVMDCLLANATEHFEVRPKGIAKHNGYEYQCNNEHDL